METAHMGSASCPNQKLQKLDHAAPDVVMAEDAEFLRGGYISKSHGVKHIPGVTNPEERSSL